MRIEMRKSVATTLFDTASAVMAKNTTAPILDCFHVKTNGLAIIVTASDGENYLSVKGDVISSSEDGVFCLPAGHILESLKALPEQPIVFEVNKNKELIITHSNGQFSLMTMEADEYPTAKDEEHYDEVVLPGEVMMSAVKNCLYATANDEIRLVMNGIYMDGLEDGVCFVGTNGRVCSRYKNKVAKSGKSVILPKKACLITKRFVYSSTEVHLFIGERLIKMVANDVVFYFRQVEGRYPNYNAVFPASPTMQCIAEREDVISALKRVAVFCNQSSGLAKFHFENNVLTISGQDNDYATSAEERVTCEFSLSPFDIGLNVAMLTEILGTMTCDSVKIELIDPTKPVLIRPTVDDENNELVALVMPMML